MISETASKMAVLAAWRMLLVENVRERANELQTDAHRCSRIAQNSINLHLADELEEIGRSFKQDRNLLVSRMQAAAYQLKLPWAGPP